MEPMIATYSFTINGYDVTITIAFFPHITVLEDSSLDLTDDESRNVELNLWNSQQLKVYIVLSYFIAKTFYSQTIFCRNILPLGHLLQKYFTVGLFFCRNILPLGYFLQKHFATGPFSAETLYCWVISYSMFFNCADVSIVGIVCGPLLSVSI